MKCKIQNWEGNDLESREDNTHPMTLMTRARANDDAMNNKSGSAGECSYKRKVNE